MISEGTRRFDLYDFFSVLIPGATFLIGLFPFFPQDFPTSTTVLAGFLILGFVFGRGIHALGLQLESPSSDEQRLTKSVGGYVIRLSNLGVTTGHRDYFVSELVDPTNLSEGLVKTFYDEATDAGDSLSLPQEWSALSTDEHDEELETLYTIVRSHIHIDARGRSRTFQAVLDFQRTMTVVSFLLFVVYASYAIAAGFHLVPPELIGYNTYIRTLQMEPWVIFFGAIVVLLGAYTTFERVRSNYRRYFIQYLLSDYITLMRATRNEERS